MLGMSSGAYLSIVSKAVACWRESDTVTWAVQSLHVSTVRQLLAGSGTRFPITDWAHELKGKAAAEGLLSRKQAHDDFHWFCSQSI